MKYLLRESAHGGIVQNDFANTTADGLADELLALDRGKTDYLAYHLMFSFPEAETEVWRKDLDAVLADFKRRFGVFRMVAADHRDKDHYHVHLAVFAQTEDGRKLRLETHENGHPVAVAQSLRHLAEDWEDRLKVRKTGRSPERHLSLSKVTLEAAQRQFQEGETDSPVPRKMQLKADIEKAVATATDFDSLDQQAGALGIEVRIKRDDQGNPLGVSFSRDGVSIRGRDAGFTLQRLQQLYGTNPTPPGHCPSPDVAGPDRPSNHRQHTAESRPAEPASEGAEPAHPASRRAAAHERRADGGLFGETEGLIGLLTHSIPPAPGLLQIISFLLSALTQDPVHRRPFKPRRINL
jgi:hypothetical protein